MLSPKPQQSRRLERAPATNSIFEKDIVIRISVYTAIIIALFLFVAIMFIFTNPTYGFFWY